VSHEVCRKHRISHRQLYHQIILSFLAPLLICIPGNDGEQGLSGAVGIMAAVLILLLYVFFLMRTSYCYADPVKIMGKLKGSLLGIFFLIYLIMTGVYILSLIEQIVPVWAVSGIAAGWLIFWAVESVHMVRSGMQRRGRMAGVSGGNFFICDHTYAAVVYRAGECRISERNAAGKSLVGKGDRLQHI